MFCKHSWLREFHNDVSIFFASANLVCKSFVDNNNMKNMAISNVTKGVSVAWRISKENKEVYFQKSCITEGIQNTEENTIQKNTDVRINNWLKIPECEYRKYLGIS